MNRITNIELYQEPLSKEKYLRFMSSLDCYVFVTKGEGFSITPREALALAIPCIISDNTAQSTICKSGLVKVAPNNKAHLAYYSVLHQACGF